MWAVGLVKRLRVLGVGCRVSDAGCSFFFSLSEVWGGLECRAWAVGCRAPGKGAAFEAVLFVIFGFGRGLYADTESLSSASSGRVMFGSRSSCICLGLWVLDLGSRYLAGFGPWGFIALSCLRWLLVRAIQVPTRKYP